MNLNIKTPVRKFYIIDLFNRQEQIGTDRMWMILNELLMPPFYTNSYEYKILYILY